MVRITGIPVCFLEKKMLFFDGSLWHICKTLTIIITSEGLALFPDLSGFN